MKKYLLLLPFLLFFFAPQAHAASFLFSRTITVTSTASIASGTNANFPMLVSSTLTSWKSSSNGGDIQNLVTAPNGGQEAADLVFATSSANCTAGSYLNFETESYSSSTGALVDWVNVPSLSAGSVIYACYDASGVTTDQSHPSSTWNSNYAFVLHFASPTGTLQLNDSTANHNNGIVASAGGEPPATTTVATTSMMIDGSVQGSAGTWLNPEITIPSSTSINITSTLTFSFWGHGTGGNPAFPILSRGSNGIFSGGSGDYVLRLGSSGGGWGVDGTNTSTNPFAAPNGAAGWQFVTYTYTTSSLWTICTNATTCFTQSNFGPGPTIGSTPANNDYIGGPYTIGTNGSTWSDLYDETELSNVVRSQSYILSEYNNQLAPDDSQSSSGFYHVGAETAFPSGSSGEGNIIASFWNAIVRGLTVL